MNKCKLCGMERLDEGKVWDVIEKQVSMNKSITNEDDLLEVISMCNIDKAICSQFGKSQIDVGKIGKALGGLWSGLRNNFAEAYCYQDKKTPNLEKIATAIAKKLER